MLTLCHHRSQCSRTDVGPEGGKEGFLETRGKHYIFFPKDECSWCSLLLLASWCGLQLSLSWMGTQTPAKCSLWGWQESEEPSGDEETLVLLLRLMRGLLLGGSNIWERALNEEREKEQDTSKKTMAWDWFLALAFLPGLWEKNEIMEKVQRNLPGWTKIVADWMPG